jgi:RNA polymerase sigma factor (sigma-70 family)
MDKARERVIDELLVIRCQEGSRESFELLMRRWQRRLWRYARRLTGSEDAAWDVMQETWLAILRQIPKLSDPAWFAVWAYRIVRNKSVDYTRFVIRQRQLAETLVEENSAKSVRNQADSSESLLEAMRRLPPDQQELLALKYSAELSVVEIAVVLGIPAGTVKSRLHYIREHLRQIIQGDKS